MCTIMSLLEAVHIAVRVRGVRLSISINLQDPTFTVNLMYAHGDVLQLCRLDASVGWRNIDVT